MARGNVMCNGNAIFLSRGNSLSKEGERGFGHGSGHAGSLYYQLIHCSQISIIKRNYVRECIRMYVV